MSQIIDAIKPVEKFEQSKVHVKVTPAFRPTFLKSGQHHYIQSKKNRVGPWSFQKLKLNWNRKKASQVFGKVETFQKIPGKETCVPNLYLKKAHSECLAQLGRSLVEEKYNQKLV